MAGELRVEGEGATLGEAKWNAAKELERESPGLAQDDIEFEVLDEGDSEAGRPARVARVVLALGLRATVDIDESDEEIRATVNGDDLGILIGKHGTTIDALQHLAFRGAFHGDGDRKQVVVDAAGYRERREAALRRAADRAVEDALSFGRAVELEPMGPHERRAVHVYLRERADVDTHSEGDEPERRLVVTPVRLDGER
jgi:spoIIIJ-associated protein